MTKKELSQLFYLNREIEREKQRLQELENASTCTTSTVSGLPHMSCISNKTAISAEIADCKNVIEGMAVQSVAEYNRLNRYIANIDDGRVRQIVQLRYMRGLTWQQVAVSLGGNTADGVRMIHKRYLLRDK